MASKPAQRIRFFYCYECRQYEPKTAPHYAAQRRRLTQRKKKRAAERTES